MHVLVIGGLDNPGQSARHFTSRNFAQVTGKIQDQERE